MCAPASHSNWLTEQLREAERNVRAWPAWKLREAGLDKVFPAPAEATPGNQGHESPTPTGHDQPR